MIAWVIGAGGLLGSSIVEEAQRRTGWQIIPQKALAWNDPEAFRRGVERAMGELLEASERRGEPWSVVWAAGSVVTASAHAETDRELSQLSEALGIMARAVSGSSQRGAIFYASSAGGVYAGSSNPPFTEMSRPAPISPYGIFKLAAEHSVAEFAQTAGVSSLVGRIANLYGPGQRLEKMQGLVSHIAKAQYSVHPATIYVPLDNCRDYLFVSDAANLVLDAMERLHAEARVHGTTHVTKIFASGQGVTVGSLLGHFRAITKARPHVTLGYSHAAAFQALDLRLRSIVWTDIDRRELTPLAAGIHATILAIMAEITSPAKGSSLGPS